MQVGILMGSWGLARAILGAEFKSAAFVKMYDGLDGLVLTLVAELFHSHPIWSWTREWDGFTFHGGLDDPRVGGCCRCLTTAPLDDICAIPEDGDGIGAPTFLSMRHFTAGLSQAYVCCYPDLCSHSR